MDTKMAPEIAFFDVETTVPTRPGSGYALLEFGAIVVCPKTLVEFGSYSTLIRPSDPNSISAFSVRCNGITKDSVSAAPSFADVADEIFTTLHGRVWAGHNIGRFDCVRIKEAFAEIGKPAPEPRGMIDTLPLLTQRFGRRAGNMKMATLATYFGLGQQKHRSLEDVRMNLEVLKYCATVLFLESSLPDLLSMTSSVIEDATQRNQDSTNASPGEAKENLNSLPDPISNQCLERKPIEVNDQAESDIPVSNTDASDLMAHMEHMNIDPSRRSAMDDAGPPVHSPETCTTACASEGSSGCAGFLDLDEVSVQCVSVYQVHDNHRGPMKLLHHRDAPLQLCCQGLRVQFGISNKFADYAGRPKVNIVVNVPARLCQILDACDRIVQKSGLDSGSSSEWRPTIIKNKYSNSSSIRLHMPVVGIRNSNVATIYSTEIFKKEPSGDIQELSRSDVLEQLFVPGTIVDAYFSLDLYDFQQNAGIRLVAKRLIAHPI